MAARTSYAPGTFSWVDLATTDADAARAFYGGLFGWDTTDTAWRRDGAAVCGLADVRPGPTAWINHVTVDDAAALASRAAGLGGRAIGPALLEDPQGALLGLWEAQPFFGAEHVNDVGCLCMNELVTNDLDGARAYYEALFGWTSEIVAPGVAFVHNDGAMNASFVTSSNGERPHWRPCFTVASVEDTVERVLALGGSVVVEPEDNPDGRVAVARDPGGAVFSVYAGEVDP